MCEFVPDLICRLDGQKKFKINDLTELVGVRVRSRLNKRVGVQGSHNDVMKEIVLPNSLFVLEGCKGG